MAFRTEKRACFRASGGYITTMNRPRSTAKGNKQGIIDIGNGVCMGLGHDRLTNLFDVCIFQKIILPEIQGIEHDLLCSPCFRLSSSWDDGHQPCDQLFIQLRAVTVCRRTILTPLKRIEHALTGTVVTQLLYALPHRRGHPSNPSHLLEWIAVRASAWDNTSQHCLFREAPVRNLVMVRILCDKNSVQPQIFSLPCFHPPFM